MKLFLKSRPFPSTCILNFHRTSRLHSSCANYIKRIQTCSERQSFSLRRNNRSWNCVEVRYESENQKVSYQLLWSNNDTQCGLYSVLGTFGSYFRTSKKCPWKLETHTLGGGGGGSQKSKLLRMCWNMLSFWIFFFLGGGGSELTANQPYRHHSD